MLKKHFLILLISIFSAPLSLAAYLGQSIQINTHFKSITAKPTWLLIIRDEQNNQVLPYLFDIRNNDNFWIAFSYGHSYRVTVSTLKFGPFAVINNFCHLENGILSGKSMSISLTGDLTPDPQSSQCHVLQYEDAAYYPANNS